MNGAARTTRTRAGFSRRISPLVVPASLLLALAGAAGTAPALTLLGTDVAPGERRQLSLTMSESFAGVSVATPVIVARGAQPGPVLCLTAGIHGDELIGVEIVRRVLEWLSVDELSGTVIGVPIANPHGFRRSSRYLPDRRDLNRFFPGRERGSAASRIAFRIFESVVRHCDRLVDFHTGSFHRTNLPQLRADLRFPEVAEMAQGFGSEIVLHSSGQFGTMRRAALGAGIPAITYEAGEPMRFRNSDIGAGVEGVHRLMHALGMSPASAPSGAPQQVYYRSRWIRSEDGGILLTAVLLGQPVGVGDILGTVTDPISNERTILRSPAAGRLIGMALNQVVIPGFAAFHLAVEGGGPEDVSAGPEETDDEFAVERDEGYEDSLRPEE